MAYARIASAFTQSLQRAGGLLPAPIPFRLTAGHSTETEPAQE